MSSTVAVFDINTTQQGKNAGNDPSMWGWLVSGLQHSLLGDLQSTLHRVVGGLGVRFTVHALLTCAFYVPMTLYHGCKEED